MRYDITLRISYRYNTPAGAARMHLRMLPLTSSRQRLLSGLVSVDPAPDDRRDRTDFFGNAVTELAFDSAVDALDFRFSGRVRREDFETELDLSCPLDTLGTEVRQINALGAHAPHHFLGASERVRPVPEITAFARDAIDAQMSALAAVQAVSSALHETFEFDPTATDVTTDPAEAFAQKRGVCQDISHVMICALRAIGVPAGYVSGYLRTDPPEGQPRLEGADAMHAWVRAWCGHDMGWIEIDPTNDMQVGTDHVQAAMGRDYADVAPVKGSLRISGGHTTGHSVDVVPLD